MEFVKVTRLAKYSADVYYNGDGFFYRADNSTGTRIHLKCISDKICKARASIPLKKLEWNMESFVKHGVHTHVPDPAYISVETLRYNILERCKSETTPFKVIYDEECARFPAEVSGRIGYYSLTSSMYRARRASQNVVIPQTLGEYGLMVEANERYCKSLGKEDFYRGTVTDENAGAAVIFASERFLRLLPLANELHMDATFKVVPSVPPCYQLFTIMAIHFDHAFPVISVVMERRTRKTYDNIFDFIKTIVPGLKPTTIMTDYEKALQRSVQAAFPDSQLVGCWFHVANIYQEPITAERNDTELIRHPVGSDEDQPLPLIYREYRYKPVILSGNQLWPTRYIEIQKEELMHSLALSDEASVEWTISSTSPLCTMCEMNEANRLCSPCGHRICCGPCLSSFLDIPISMPVTNGNVTQSIPVRGPLCCPECRAVIGFIITIL